MRRKTNIEIEFPLQVDAVLAGVAMVASALRQMVAMQCTASLG